jgi:hypothetical protein
MKRIKKRLFSEILRKAIRGNQKNKFPITTRTIILFKLNHNLRKKLQKQENHTEFQML